MEAEEAVGIPAVEEGPEVAAAVVVVDTVPAPMDTPEEVIADRRRGMLDTADTAVDTVAIGDILVTAGDTRITDTDWD
jgi:hypothetical protein